MTYIIILNWNNWKDTIECLESVFRLQDARFRVVVCDNASTDGSLEYIRDWANDNLCAVAENLDLAMLITPPVPKPIPLSVISPSDTFSGLPSLLYLLPTGGNFGFAGGCNVGIRFALSDPECRYVWVLNNDTVVRPDALKALTLHVEGQPQIGLCGSALYYYHSPTELQALGGHYNRLLGTTRHLYEEDIRRGTQPDYVVGAAMLASREFIERTGLMDDSYFLYYEEHDWACRRPSDLQLGLAQDSIVYHKEGATTRGGRRFLTNPSRLADFYGMRNRLRFARKHDPVCYPIVWITTLLPIAKRLLRGQVASAWRVLGLMGNPDRELFKK